LDVQQLAREYTSEAVEALVRGLQDPKCYIAAAVALLERGWGKPTQPIASDEERPVAIHFSWASDPPEPQPQAAPVFDAPTDADDPHSSTPLTLVWDGPEPC
jgi:hypothetical protein